MSGSNTNITPPFAQDTPWSTGGGPEGPSGVPYVPVAGQTYDPGAQPQVDSFPEGQGGFFNEPSPTGTAVTAPAAGTGQSTTPIGPAVTPALPFPGTMLMPFVVEDGTGYNNSTSYVSLANANIYISANVHAAPVWTSLDPADQMNLLIAASRYIDQRTRWNGDRAHRWQALGWPRRDIQDRDGHEIPHWLIPMQVQQATVEMARFMIAQDRSIERDQDGLREIEVDVVRLFFDPQYRLPAMPPLIAFILMDLGAVSSGRMASAKIRNM